jgi:uncharacterized protein YbaR (Trm112 family)
MIDHRLLEFARCPISHQSLRMISDEQLKEVNDLIAAGEISNRAGETVTRQLQSAIVTLDEKIVYPIWDNIPAIIPSEAIEIKE